MTHIFLSHFYSVDESAAACADFTGPAAATMLKIIPQFQTYSQDDVEDFAE